jgi:hypothetical protein
MSKKFSGLTVLIALLLTGCSSGNHGSFDVAPMETFDASLAIFTCTDIWICGGDVPRIELKPETDGCYLRGLPGRNLLAPDGTITAGGVVVGKATNAGARVRVLYPDGGQWLFCARSGA